MLDYLSPASGVCLFTQMHGKSSCHCVGLFAKCLALVFYFFKKKVEMIFVHFSLVLDVTDDSVSRLKADGIRNFIETETFSLVYEFVAMAIGHHTLSELNVLA